MSFESEIPRRGSGQTKQFDGRCSRHTTPGLSAPVEMTAPLGRSHGEGEKTWRPPEARKIRTGARTADSTLSASAMPVKDEKRVSYPLSWRRTNSWVIKDKSWTTY